MIYTTGASCLALPCSLSSCFFSPFSIVITSLGEEGAGQCAFRALCLFILHALIFVLFLFLWCEGLAAVSDMALPGLFY